MATEQVGQSPRVSQSEEEFNAALRPTTGRSAKPVFPVYVEIVAAPGADADPAIDNVIAQLSKKGDVVVADERELMTRDPGWLGVARSNDPEKWDAARTAAAGRAADLARQAREREVHYVRVTDGTTDQAYAVGAAERENFDRAAGWSLQQLTVVPSSHVGYITDATLRVNAARSAASDQAASTGEGASRIAIPSLAEYEERLERSIGRAVTPSADTDFEKSGVVANGRTRPFQVGTSKDEASSERSLTEVAREAAERNPEKRLGRYRADGRFVQDGAEALRTDSEVADESGSIRQLAQEYSGANAAADSWGPQRAGLAGRAADAVVKVTDAVSGARRSSHKPSSVRLNPGPASDQTPRRGM
ncbi:hypothetical protein [Marinitenerispora sediminis]|uniref:hypothetical protein n=1 Tax=Marinitenerispora sediminis TaxID=1931232 RepID=UPI0013141C89|nr:hypothetical protein [Marinitenerispora sediminis]